MILPDSINKKRKEGFRPEIVGCFLHEKKVFMFYDKKHDLWQFPQGGIDNKEIIGNALEREMTEELGVNFVSQIENSEFLAQDRINFPEKYWGSRSLQDDEGTKIEMKGKCYYSFAVQTKAESVILEETEFDDYLLASHNQAEAFLIKVYQKEKRRISIRFLEVLASKKLIT